MSNLSRSKVGVLKISMHYFITIVVVTAHCDLMYVFFFSFMFN